MTRKQRRAAERMVAEQRAWVSLAELPLDQVELLAHPEAKAQRLATTTAVIKGAATRVFGNARWFTNPTYLVSLQPAAQPAGWLHIRIQRHDGRAPNSWPDMQQIKNQLAGVECEGVELFPAESRLLHVGHVRHIWANPDPGDRLEVGLHNGRHVDERIARG